MEEGHLNNYFCKLMVSIKRSVSLWHRPFYKNMLNYDNDNKYQKLWTTQRYIFFDYRADNGFQFERELD